MDDKNRNDAIMGALFSNKKPDKLTENQEKILARNRETYERGQAAQEAEAKTRLPSKDGQQSRGKV